MKIRNGFVSNSSSSSFIVAFPRKPKNVDDLGFMMFGQDYEDPHKAIPCCAWNKEEAYGLSRIARTVWEDMQKKKSKIDKKKMHKAFDIAGYYIKDFSFDDYCTENNIGFDHEKYNKDREEAIKGAVKDFLSSCPKGSVFYMFKYADDDGPFFATMEHGDIFKRIKHIRFSNH